MGNFESQKRALERVKGEGRLYVAMGEDKVENGRAQELKNHRKMGNFQKFVSKKGALEGVKGKGRGDVALGDDKIEDGRPQELQEAIIMEIWEYLT